MTRAGVIIAIDGPAGSGKSTLARALARRLDLLHIDTGAVYRTVALRALERGVDLADGASLAKLADEITLDAEGGRFIIDGTPPGDAIRTREVSIAASRTSVHPEVRERLVAKQRELLHRAGGVAEGRDIGTVVAPDATLKVFLTATPLERARRRLQDHRDVGHDVALDALAAEIAERDERDANREVSPLRPAEDAIRIDTTGRDAEEIIERLVLLLDERTVS